MRMRIFKLLSTAFLAASLCLGGPVACTKRAARECVLTSEDYAVYSAVFLDFAKLGFRVGDKTDLIFSDVTLSAKQGYVHFEDPRPLLKQVSEDTVAHFSTQQDRTCHLKPQLDPKISYQIISEESLLKIFRKGGDWPAFEKEYPKSFGIWQLSPIGYNAKGTEALVYVTHNCGGGCGSGHLVVLARQNGNWSVKEQTQVWMS